MKKLIVITLFLLSLLAQPVFSKCIVSQQRVDAYTTLVFVDMDCNGWVDTVETWKWNGVRWVLVGIRPY